MSFYFFFYWSIVAVHCCVSFCCNPLQYSCLENPRDRGTWWAAIYGVAQSRARLKRLSSSSSSIPLYTPVFEFPSHLGYYRAPSRVPCAMQQVLLLSYLFYTQQHISRASWVVLVVKNCLQCRHKRCGFNTWAGKVPWRRAWQPTPVFLPGESHGQRSLMGYSPQSCKESDITETTSHACGVYMSIPISQFIPPHIPPQCPYVSSLHLCLYFYFANKIIYTIFLDFK